jgi:hypothetical protein
MKFHNYNQEKMMHDMREECLRTGKNVAYQSSMIIDVEGLSMRQIVCKSGIISTLTDWLLNTIIVWFDYSRFPAVDVGTEAAKVNVLNYPDIVRRIFVINGNEFCIKLVTYYMRIKIDFFFSFVIISSEVVYGHLQHFKTICGARNPSKNENFRL